MNDESKKDQSRHLPVLPHSGKVEQMRNEASAQRPPRSDQPHPATTQQPDSAESEQPEAKPLKEKVVDAIRTVYDPEIPVNLYDLGLIYDIQVNEENDVHIRMTLTAPACPVAEVLPSQVESRVESIPEVKSASVELVWDPPWTREMMSEAAQLELGMM